MGAWGRAGRVFRRRRGQFDQQSAVGDLDVRLGADRKSRVSDPAAGDANVRTPPARRACNGAYCDAAGPEVVRIHLLCCRLCWCLSQVCVALTLSTGLSESRGQRLWIADFAARAVERSHTESLRTKAHAAPRPVSRRTVFWATRPIRCGWGNAPDSVVTSTLLAIAGEYRGARSCRRWLK
jgi:hypothetical protein